MGAVLEHKVPVGRVGVVEFLQLVLHPDEGRLELAHTDVKLVGSVDVKHQNVDPAAKTTGLAQFFTKFLLVQQTALCVGPNFNGLIQFLRLLEKYFRSPYSWFLILKEKSIY